MRKYLLFGFTPIVLALVSVLAQSQQLTFQTEAGKQTVLSRADLEDMPHVKVTTSQNPTTFEGVTLREGLGKGGIAFGESLRGKRPCDGAFSQIVAHPDDYMGHDVAQLDFFDGSAQLVSR